MKLSKILILPGIIVATILISACSGKKSDGTTATPKSGEITGSDAASTGSKTEPSITESPAQYAEVETPKKNEEPEEVLNGSPLYKAELRFKTGKMNVRKKPGIEHEILEQLENHTAVEVYAEVDDTWAKIKTTKGVAGYVQKQFYVRQLEGEISDADYLQLPNLPANAYKDRKSEGGYCGEDPQFRVTLVGDIQIGVLPCKGGDDALFSPWWYGCTTLENVTLDGITWPDGSTILVNDKDKVQKVSQLSRPVEINGVQIKDNVHFADPGDTGWMSGILLQDTEISGYPARGGEMVQFAEGQLGNFTNSVDISIRGFNLPAVTEINGAFDGTEFVLISAMVPEPFAYLNYEFPAGSTLSFDLEENRITHAGRFDGRYRTEGEPLPNRFLVDGEPLDDTVDFIFLDEAGAISDSGVYEGCSC